MAQSDEVAINILSSQEEEELRLQNELNNAFILEDDAMDVEDVNETLSRSQLIAKLHQKEKKLAKKEEKIQKLKQYIREYRKMVEHQYEMFDMMCNHIENENERREWQNDKEKEE
jgi:hypothetical protein